MSGWCLGTLGTTPGSATAKVLGTGVINDNPHFKCDKKAIENRVDYRSLMEAIANDDLHQRFEARVEVAATSTDLDFLRNLDVTVVAEELVANNLLIVEVETVTLKQYMGGVVDNLFAPMEAAARG